ncbi:hypothetical protein VFPPC_12242 [Pochonia chlamydosporia 170]|uniref:Uncharacterized protein n=1 Tax=Pochonia chlamydosporia 170 TaxID=1380566 RepID=A0A179EZF0_METCM|nr:hypothetical protein VFPPC_12242 [Pochonia chlamydosporia 170]OAQ58279.1 hypothetical protein VFPPC_12242 [Pochonia chlamydosporia 170]
MTWCMTACFMRKLTLTHPSMKMDVSPIVDNFSAASFSTIIASFNLPRRQSINARVCSVITITASDDVASASRSLCSHRLLCLLLSNVMWANISLTELLVIYYVRGVFGTIRSQQIKGIKVRSSFHIVVSPGVNCQSAGK